MQGLLVFFLFLFLMLILTAWVLGQPLRRNAVMRQETARLRAGGAGSGQLERRRPSSDRRARADRRVSERRRTDVDASLGHA